MKRSSISSFRLALMAGVSSVTPAFAVVAVDYVSIGNAGNAADSATGYGAVSYDYNIGTYETTITQYAEFLNAAAQTDPHELYNSSMGTNSNIAGITRSGASGTYNYTVTGSGNRPITYVSWYDAARFANWMHNGQGNGNTETGAYTLAGNTGTIIKNVGATVWLPSENEWYKAAYYDPTTGAAGGDSYWLYPTQSETLTNNTVSANYFDGDFAVTQGGGYSGSQNYLTNVGAYGASSSSYFGTLDQGGNVWEWNDLVTNGSWRGLRGGSWIQDGDFAYVLLSSSRNSNTYPSTESDSVGFRLASVPEPTSLFLTILSSGVMLTRRKR